MKLNILLLLLFTGIVQGFSQDVSFKASTESVVEVGEQFYLKYTLNESGEDLRLPEFDGFTLLAGPSMQTSTNVSINGTDVRREKSITYTYVLLAEKEGEFTIPAASVVVNGKTLQSNALKVKVIAGGQKRQSGSAQSAQQSQQQQQESSSSNSGAVSQENLFLRLEVNRKSLYLGEALIATLKVYVRDVELSGFGRSKFASLDGFTSEEVEVDSRLTRAEYNGKIYYSAPIYQCILFPQYSGELTIEPFEVECMVRQRVKGRSTSIFDDFFDNVRTVPIARRTAPVKINVKPLPAGKPAAFSGFVGNVTMRTSISADTMRANDALTYKVIFQGNGNMKVMEAPKLNLPPDFEVYDPKVTRNVRTASGNTTGTVTFEYLIIPRFGGDYTIPQVSWSYFNPKEESYRTLTSETYNIHVIKGNEPASSGGDAAVQSFRKEDVRLLGEDIRYIKSGHGKLKPQGVRFYGSWGYMLSFIVPLFIFIVGSLLNRQRIKANADMVRVKSKAANKMARRRLKAAATALRAHNPTAFYQEILTALWGYVSYKLNIPSSELNRDNVNELLSRQGVSEELITQFIGSLDKSEFARYAPDSDSDQEMDKIYGECVELITKLDKTL